MTAPRLLDLFCCEGGAGTGYRRAGFSVYGVDIFTKNSQRRYPFPSHRGDALQFVADHAHEFDVIHASPPCQAYSITKHSHSNDHPDLLGPTRDALIATEKPYIIENVVGAPMDNPLTLCGTEFGLTATDHDGTRLHLKRHRLFESNMPLMGAGGCGCRDYKRAGYRVAGAYGGGSVDRTHAQFVRRGGYTPPKPLREQLLGIDWMTLNGLSQSIPPAYTHFLGTQLLELIERAA